MKLSIARPAAIQARWQVSSVVILGALACWATAQTAHAAPVSAVAPLQAALAPARITAPIDDAVRVATESSGHLLASAGRDQGEVQPGRALSNVQLLLKRSPQAEAELRAFEAAQQDPASPDYQHWLSAAEIGQRFGPARKDIDTVVRWLGRQGVQVKNVAQSGMTLTFDASAAQVNQVFKTPLHSYVLADGTHVANTVAPSIPAALSDVVAGVTALHNLKARPLVARHPKPQFASTLEGSTLQYVTPGDFARIYNIEPLRTQASPLLGAGQKIAVVEDSDMYEIDWQNFRKAFKLAGYGGTFVQTHPGSACSDPGTTDAEVEAALDAEWVTAVAPAAAVEVASCNDSDDGLTFGFQLAIQGVLEEAHPASVISVSYGLCEPVLTKQQTAAIQELYRQAALQGVTVVVASGDQGSSTCSQFVGDAYAALGTNVNAFAATPYNVAVGGTDFLDAAQGTGAQYWSKKNRADLSSALSYVPESTWNDTCASAVLIDFLGKHTNLLPGKGVAFTDSPAFVLTGRYATDAANLCTMAESFSPDTGVTYAYDFSGLFRTTGGGGGISSRFHKPSWQVGLVSPANYRHLPDVSLFAATGLWGHALLLCMSDASEHGSACDYTLNPYNAYYNSAGGTSFASPAFAGIQALINQKKGKPQGNVGARLYDVYRASMAAVGLDACDASLGSAIDKRCVFHNVTQGNIEVPCNADGASDRCYYGTTATGTSYPPTQSPYANFGSVDGITSLKPNSFHAAYAAGPGWNYATGLGSVNVANLVNAW